MAKELKVTMGICMPKNLKAAIDLRRGDVPRSVFISKILEKDCKEYKKENTTCYEISDQWGLSRHQPGGGPTEPSIPAESDATNG